MQLAAEFQRAGALRSVRILHVEDDPLYAEFVRASLAALERIEVQTQEGREFPAFLFEPYYAACASVGRVVRSTCFADAPAVQYAAAPFVQ